MGDQDKEDEKVIVAMYTSRVTHTVVGQPHAFGWTWRISFQGFRGWTFDRDIQLTDFAIGDCMNLFGQRYKSAWIVVVWDVQRASINFYHLWLCHVLSFSGNNSTCLVHMYVISCSWEPITIVESCPDRYNGDHVIPDPVSGTCHKSQERSMVCILFARSRKKRESKLCLLLVIFRLNVVWFHERIE